MRTVSVDQLAQFLSGAGTVYGPGHVPVKGISIDSRTLRPGELFVALVGERFDGHHFVEAALEGGAAAVMADPARLPEPVRRRWVAGTGAEAGTPPLLAVDDTLAGLQRLAAGYIRRLRVTVVGVTGSTGKTTTKDMLAAMLGAWQPTVKSMGNQNNDIGVPLTLFRADETTRFAVVEMGMRAPGEVARLCRVAGPKVGLITNVGLAHVGRLGSVQALAEAKGELVEALPADGTAVLNGDDEWCRRMARRSRARVLWYGRAEDAALRLVGVESRGLEGLRVEAVWQEERLRPEGKGLAEAPRPVRFAVPVPGRHNAHNALGAAVAALSLGCPWEAVTAGLGRVGEQRTGMRLDVVQLEDLTVIDDAYNASPPSVRAALGTLREAKGRRRIAVLGDMVELGDYAPRAHEQVGRWAAEAGVDVLIAAGQWAGTIVRGAREAGFTGSASAVADAAQAAEAALAALRPGDVCLVKASRAVGLERVVAAIKGAWTRGAAGGGSRG